MKDFFDKYNIKKNDKIIIACSWWSDSMFLLEEILSYHPQKNIIVCHFNHNLRDKESIRDENFVKNFCEKKWIIAEFWNAKIKEISQKNKTSIEETARKLRYKFLEKIAKKYKSEIIMTAHHLDDSIETFLFNLIRWSKLNWLTWIDEKNGNIYRPLNKLTKAEILEKCSKRNIEYIEDSSNKDDKFLRNHIRLNIIPQFSGINPNYQKAFLNTMEYFKQLNNNNVKKYSKLINENILNIEDFEGLSMFEQKELIAYIYKITNNWTIGLSKWNIDEVIKYIRSKWNYTKKQIKNMNLLKKNWKIYII